MNELTSEETKWFKSLKRCFSKMPEGVEILSHEMYNGRSGICSDIHIFKKGVIRDTQDEVDDLPCYDPADYSCDSFRSNKTASNNHGY